MSPPNVGLIGCGFIGRFHSTAIRGLIRLGLVDVNYAAVCDLDEDRARGFADAANVPLTTTDPLEIVESPDIDVVYVCLPTAAHKDLVLQAAANGKHVFCEKPLATNLADVEEMVAAVDRAGVSAGVGLVLRHSPILTVLKSLMDDPTLGRLMVVVLRDDQFFPIQGHYSSDWRADKARAGGGTLIEHSIHDVDVLRWLAGDVTSVRGSTRNFAGHDGIEDLAMASLEFENGASAELTSVWHNVLGRPSTRRIEVFMENAVFTLDDDFVGPIQLQSHARSREVIPEEEVRRRYLEIAGMTDPTSSEALKYSFEDYFFLRSIIDGTKPFPDFRVALDAHRIVDAVYRSAAGGGAAVAVA
jgi:predicted dehydrogenase